jgi:hypothetical protein
VITFNLSECSNDLNAATPLIADSRDYMCNKVANEKIIVPFSDLEYVFFQSYSSCRTYGGEERCI